MVMLSGTTLFYAILAGFVPSFIWLMFWLREDSRSSEPKSMLALTFFSGMLVVVAAVIVEKTISEMVSNESLRYTLWAATEEILKFLAVGVIALTTDYNDEPIDAMVYCITAALGFAAIENMFFAMGPLSSGSIAQSIITGNLRFIGATLVHTVSSAAIGFSLGLVFFRGYLSKTVAVLIGLAAAITVHAAFNLALINSSAGDTLRAFAWIWGAVVLLIVMFEEVKAVRPKPFFT
jgi:RsiW-degrading membrane proteinase PrsW (M82 family)